jgi:hypothetical protein
MIGKVKLTSHWACKRCKGKFQTLAEMRYHNCVPKPFVRPAKRRGRAR